MQNMLKMPAAEYFDVNPGTIEMWWVLQKPHLMDFAARHLENYLNKNKVSVKIRSKGTFRYLRYSSSFWIPAAIAEFGKSRQQLVSLYKVRNAELMTFIALFLNTYLIKHKQIIISNKSGDGNDGE